MNRITLAQLLRLAARSQPYQQDKSSAEVQIAKAHEKRQRRARKNLKANKETAVA